MGRLTEGKGLYTNLALPGGVQTVADRKCALKQIEFYKDLYRWRLAGRPGGMAHINLEEASAMVWSVHDRLRRPGEEGKKILQLVDSAVLCGAAKKGRSASRRLNRYMRKLLSCLLAGGFEMFVAWLASASNPSDEPSSWFGIRAKSLASRVLSRKSHRY